MDAVDINPIEVFLRDPIMLIAERFVDPEITFKLKVKCTFATMVVVVVMVVAGKTLRLR